MSLSRFHPFRTKLEGLSPELVTIGKFLVLYCVFNRLFSGFGKIYISFLPWINKWSALYDLQAYDFQLRLIWNILFIIFSTFIVFNFRFRFAAFCLSLMLFFGILFSQLNYSNNAVFAAMIFLIISLSPEHFGPWAIRFQLGLIYFGAMLDKLLSSAWRDGSFFLSWKENSIWVEGFSPLVSAESLALIYSWGAIVVEGFLSLGSLIPPLSYGVMSVGSLFHASTTLMDGNFFGVFVLGMMISYRAFARYPNQCHLFYRKAIWMDRILAFFIRTLDHDERFKLSEGSSLQLVTSNRKSWSGGRAFKISLLSLPAFYFLLAIVFNNDWMPFSLQTALLFGLILVFLPYPYKKAGL